MGALYVPSSIESQRKTSVREMEPGDTQDQEYYPHEEQSPSSDEGATTEAAASETPYRRASSQSASSDLSDAEDLDVELGEEGYILLSDLIDDIQVMYEFARRSGKQLSHELEKDISRVLSSTPIETSSPS